MLLAKQLFCTSDTRKNTSQYWFLYALMIIPMQFFPLFLCFFSFSLLPLSLMAMLTDELMVPEPAAVPPLLLGSLPGVTVHTLGPVPLERHSLRGWLLSRCLSPPQGVFGSLLPECRFRAVKLSDFPLPLV